MHTTIKSLLLTTAILLGFLFVQAQPPAGFRGPGMMPSSGHIYGKITDSIGKAIDGVSVLILETTINADTKQKKEVLLKGATTPNNGEFSFEDLPVGKQLRISISNIGYMQKSLDVTLKAPVMEKDLGNISLNYSPTELSTVVVTASTRSMRLDIDKKVFNVDKNIVSAGGTATDVMKNVPGINVDIDGNVKLRNSAPTLYIDGRPTTLTLEQVPADAIESVEVITNPSAKYDASGGGAGILNLVLKKNRKTGYNGNVRAGIDKRGAMNGGGDFNLRQGKFNLTASAMVNQQKGRTTGTTERTNLSTNPQTMVNQYDYNRNNGAFMFGKVGIDYLMSNKTSFSLSAVRVHGDFAPTNVLDINTDTLYSTGTLSGNSKRYSNSERAFNGGGLVFGMKQLFSTKGEELTVDANYFTGKMESGADYITNYYKSDQSLKNTNLQQASGFGNDRNLVIQTDYTRPFGKNTKLETGLRAALRSRENNNQNYTYNPTAGKYDLVSAASTFYTNSDNVYAAYASVSSTIKNFGYKIGLRTESSNYSGELLNTGEKFSNSYPVSLFPSIFLSQKLKNDQEMQVSVTRRINRPNFFQLIPFTDYADSLNITRGNPGLVPEFTTSFELSYLKTFQGNNTFLASAYYKKTNNLITRYIDTAINEISGKQDLINTFVNANSSYTTGLELTSTNTITKWFDMSTNVNIYNSKINADNITGGSQPALWSWFAKYNSNFKLPKSFSAQLSATYQSKTNLPVNTNSGWSGGPGGSQSMSAAQGYISANWGMDLAVKKTFLKNNAAAVTLSFNDIFRTRITNQYSVSPYFTQHYSRLRDPQMLRLTFSYRFGKMDANIFKRTSKGTGESAGGSM